MLLNETKSDSTCIGFVVEKPNPKTSDEQFPAYILRILTTLRVCSELVSQLSDLLEEIEFYLIPLLSLIFIWVRALCQGLWVPPRFPNPLSTCSHATQRPYLCRPSLSIFRINTSTLTPPLILVHCSSTLRQRVCVCVLI